MEKIIEELEKIRIEREEMLALLLKKDAELANLKDRLARIPHHVFKMYSKLIANEYGKAQWSQNALLDLCDLNKPVINYF